MNLSPQVDNRRPFSGTRNATTKSLIYRNPAAAPARNWTRSRELDLKLTASSQPLPTRTQQIEPPHPPPPPKQKLEKSYRRKANQPHTRTDLPRSSSRSAPAAAQYGGGDEAESGGETARR
uniref:Uncharacterized protein n=1 Tax=Oryza sativa subsp. japonica TaxID=39947 RepID=Q6K8M1_ORYSJ|nr:hypothetical protein [Oryza sativa Japonica Group]